MRPSTKLYQFVLNKNAYWKSASIIVYNCHNCNKTQCSSGLVSVLTNNKITQEVVLFGSRLWQLLIQHASLTVILVREKCLLWLWALQAEHSG